jgi:hypothetical protein
VTVGELIALLQTYPPDMTVKHQDGGKIEFALYDFRVRLSTRFDDHGDEPCVVLETL